MKQNKIAFEIGMVLTVLAVLTVSAVPAVNAATAYFEPQHMSAELGGYNYTVLWVDIEEGETLLSADMQIQFDPAHANITSVYKNCQAADDECWASLDKNFDYLGNGYFWGGVSGPQEYDEGIEEWVGTSDGLFHGPETVKICKFKLQAQGTPGVSPFNFGFEYTPSGCPICQPCTFFNATGKPLDVTWINGTFTHEGETTYTISGYTDPAANEVNITNLNKSTVVKHRPADYIGPDGFYNLTLNVPTEVEVGNVLQIFACDVFTDNESTCNTTTHTVVNAPGEDTNVNLTLNHYCLNWLTYPYSIWDDPNWSGPAVMQMLINHYRSEEPSQVDLNATGIAHNQACNSDLLQVDPLGMQWTLNDILHNTSSYGGGKRANYGIGSYDNVISTLHYICYWQHAGPGAAPTYGNYSNWMSIRGIHTSADPYPGPYPPGGDYEIYGFWINDPNPTGIGENSYKCVDQWTSEYYFNLTGVDDPVNDTYYNKYVAVCEPPEQPDVEITIVHSAARLDGPVKPELMGLDVVKAAIDGVNEELVPYDHAFAEVFAKTIAGRPLLVTDESGDYYLVPFNMPIEKRPIPFRKPVEIENVDGGMVKLISVVDGKAVIKPVPIELIRIKEKRTLVVVIVDAEDGSFKEASWVADPVKYLPVSKREALKFVFKEIRQSRLRPFGRPVIELVHRAASPYSPDWKITIGQMVFYVSQDGTVSYDKPLPTPTRPPRPIKPGPIRIPPI